MQEPLVDWTTTWRFRWVGRLVLGGSVGFSGTPQGHGNCWAPILGTHTTPIPESLKIWEWYGNSMGPAYHKGVPLLGVPGITIDFSVAFGLVLLNRNLRPKKPIFNSGGESDYHITWRKVAHVEFRFTSLEKEIEFRPNLEWFKQSLGWLPYEPRKKPWLVGLHRGLYYPVI